MRVSFARFLFRALYKVSRRSTSRRLLVIYLYIHPLSSCFALCFILSLTVSFMSEFVRNFSALLIYDSLHPKVKPGSFNTGAKLLFSLFWSRSYQPSDSILSCLKFHMKLLRMLYLKKKNKESLDFLRNGILVCKNLTVVNTHAFH